MSLIFQKSVILSRYFQNSMILIFRQNKCDSMNFMIFKSSRISCTAQVALLLLTAVVVLLLAAVLSLVCIVLALLLLVSVLLAPILPASTGPTALLALLQSSRSLALRARSYCPKRGRCYPASITSQSL